MHEEAVATKEDHIIESLTIAIRKFTTNCILDSGRTQSSTQKRVRAAILTQYPRFSEEDLLRILPKENGGFRLVKCQNRLTLVVARSEVLFFQHSDGKYWPHLRLLHRFPTLLPRMQCDAGGCVHVLGGADVMCPGLTSPGGVVSPGVIKGSLVRVDIEGMQHSAAIGVLCMDTDEITSSSKGIAIQTVHTMGDGLWRAHSI